MSLDFSTDSVQAQFETGGGGSGDGGIIFAADDAKESNLVGLFKNLQQRK